MTNFDDFDIRGSNAHSDYFSKCTSDYVQLGPSHKQGMTNKYRYCNSLGDGDTYLPMPFQSFRNQMWVKFKSRHSGGRGFQLTYMVGQARSMGCPNNYHCDNRKCILAEWKCDGQDQCGDNSDEINCKCSAGKKQCGNEEEDCYSAQTQTCDGTLHCLNGRDERGCGVCPSDMIRCSKVQGCYNPEDRCNGVPHCADKSDEANCSAHVCSPERGLFMCRNARCIQRSWTCDGMADCGGDDTSDEDSCSVGVKNSVIVAAIIGSLICSLLLVTSVACTCRLYSDREGGSLRLPRHLQHVRLEERVSARDLPPPYSMAVGEVYQAPFDDNRCSMLDHFRWSVMGRRGRARSSPHSSRSACWSARLPPQPRAATAHLSPADAHVEAFLLTPSGGASETVEPGGGAVDVHAETAARHASARRHRKRHRRAVARGGSTSTAADDRPSGNNDGDTRVAAATLSSAGVAEDLRELLSESEALAALRRSVLRAELHCDTSPSLPPRASRGRHAAAARPDATSECRSAFSTGGSHSRGRTDAADDCTWLDQRQRGGVTDRQAEVRAVSDPHIHTGGSRPVTGSTSSDDVQLLES
ncbi:PREDICTED: low-density lipoprotein receptor-related protein 12-like [Priapulus caudatus]|uniref:Low-density lipoprotein receptor-related protein 12-like n=1 Tax=Priapulus caudatus TaxID=37621 RepID=A0ABM1DNZ0_PRICU|nr:PREDICTED: low-density lipoprotein receptor-related protein 12-like [Priapulus caudatus]